MQYELTAPRKRAPGAPPARDILAIHVGSTIFQRADVERPRRQP